MALGGDALWFQRGRLGESTVGPRLRLLSQMRSEWTWEKTGPRGTTGQLRRRARGLLETSLRSLFMLTSCGLRDMCREGQKAHTWNPGAPSSSHAGPSLCQGYREAGLCPLRSRASSLRSAAWRGQQRPFLLEQRNTFSFGPFYFLGSLSLRLYRVMVPRIVTSAVGGGSGAWSDGKRPGLVKGDR